MGAWRSSACCLGTFLVAGLPLSWFVIPNVARAVAPDDTAVRVLVLAALSVANGAACVWAGFGVGRAVGFIRH